MGGSKEENAQITLDILNGAKGPKTDAVLLNAGAGLYVAGKVESMMEGVSLAKELIETGKAKELLERFVRYSNED